MLAAAAVLMPWPSAAIADDAGGDAGARDPATVRPIDLATAIDIARRQNDTLLGETVDVAAADATVRALAGADDVVVEASAGGTTRDTDPVDGPFFQETSLDALALSAGIWKPLSTGGRVGLELRDEVARETVRIAAGPGVAPYDIETTIHGPRAELVVMQPLLQGRGRKVAHADRRRAAAERDAQAEERRGAEAVLVHDVTTTYWELAYASEAVAIQQSALALAHEQLEITRARAEVGKLGQLEVQAVEQAIAAREAALLGARQVEDERALELRVLMAAEDGDPRAFAAADPLDGPAPTVALDGALDRALAFSPDLGVLARRVDAARVDVEVADQALLPRLDLVVRGGPAGHSDQAGDAFAQLGRFDSFEASATVTLRVPLGNHAARGQRDAARLREVRLDHGRAEVRGELVAAVRRASDAVTLAERRITAAAKARDLAAQNVDLERDRWQSGAGTNFDVMARQDQLTAAAAALARARADYRIAIAGLRYLTGDGATR
ncbi:MAG: TolC family protein [Kofleriaceae bacterium]|nr:TolC family protein [Kofleriaceae bacterium]